MTNNLNIVNKVIYVYKFEVFWQFFVVKKLSNVLNITILDIYILGIHKVSLNIFSGCIYIIHVFYAKHFLIHYFSKLTFSWYGGINISRTAHPINQNEVGMAIQYTNVSISISFLFQIFGV